MARLPDRPRGTHRVVLGRQRRQPWLELSQEWRKFPDPGRGGQPDGNDGGGQRNDPDDPVAPSFAFDAMAIHIPERVARSA